MHSRKSIPNVGRRAQGREALFMLKGNGVSHPACRDPAESTQRAMRQSVKQGSLTMEGELECGELPATYDESVLNQPSHPYNRIIRRILLRHQAAERKELHGTPRIEKDYLDQVVAANSAPPFTRKDPGIHSPGLKHTHKPPPGQADSQDGHHLRSHKTRLEEADNATCLQWADILTAEHCSRSHNDHALDVQSHTLSSPEDQSVISLDLAKGYLTDRGLISDRGSQDTNDLQECVLDTTRSEPIACSSLPNLVRKRDLQPLDDVLDYFWVYQGMSRQLLDRRGSPSYLWNRELLRGKKPTKLPPLYTAPGQKIETGSPELRTGSVQFSTVSPEDMDTPEGTPLENNMVGKKICEQKSREKCEEHKPREKNGGHTSREKMCEHKSQHSSRSPSLEFQPQSSRKSPSSKLHIHSNETQTQTDKDIGGGGGGGGGDDGDHRSGQCVFPEKSREKGQERRVTLVVKMPVLTHEMSSSDLPDNE
ncbi:hypothetical protein ACOMHN_003421 [Nucella lapillus]